MMNVLVVAIRSARVYIWLLVLVNAVAVGTDLGLGFSKSFLIATILCMLASYGFLINDLCDRKIDQINGRGRLEDKSFGVLACAIVLAFLFTSASLLLAMFYGESRVMVMTLLIWLSLTLYSVLLRPIPFISTLLASILSASPIWFPMAVATDQVRGIHAFLLGISVLAVFGRELILDVKDISGDRAYGRLTLPVLFGERFAAIVAFLFVLSSSVLVTLCIRECHTTWFSMTAMATSLASTVVFWLLPTTRVLVRMDEESISKFIVFSRIGIVAVPICALLASLNIKWFV